MEEVGVGGVGVPDRLGSTGEKRQGKNFLWGSFGVWGERFWRRGENLPANYWGAGPSGEERGEQGR